jgi:flagellar biosynthesis/type III secretory pathway protein FliH
MKLNILKRTAAIGTLGLMALLGTSQIANAQTYRDYRDYQRDQRRTQRQYERQQRQYDRQQQRAYNQRYRVYSNGRYYQTDNRGVELLRQAVNRGYQQGYRAGQSDRGYRRGYNYGGSSLYRSGNYGYQSYVDSSQYRYYFQQGFQRGYEDGYYSRNQYGYNSNGGLNILGNILSGILNISSY